MADLPFDESGYLLFEYLTDPCLVHTKSSPKVSEILKWTVVGQWRAMCPEGAL